MIIVTHEMNFAREVSDRHLHGRDGVISKRPKYTKQIHQQSRTIERKCSWRTCYVGGLMEGVFHCCY